MAPVGFFAPRVGCREVFGEAASPRGHARPGGASASACRCVAPGSCAGSGVASVEDRVKKPNDGVDDELEHKLAYAEHWLAEVRKIRAAGVNYHALRRPVYAPEPGFASETSFALEDLAEFADGVNAQKHARNYATAEDLYNSTIAGMGTDGANATGSVGATSARAPGPSASDVYTAGAKSMPSVAPPGRLEVYVDDAHTPALSVPIRFSDIMRPGNVNGTAMVGLTSSNGDDGWMLVDVLDLAFAAEEHVP